MTVVLFYINLWIKGNLIIDHIATRSLLLISSIMETSHKSQDPKLPESTPTKASACSAVDEAKDHSILDESNQSGREHNVVDPLQDERSEGMERKAEQLRMNKDTRDISMVVQTGPGSLEKKAPEKNSVDSLTNVTSVVIQSSEEPTSKDTSVAVVMGESDDERKEDQKVEIAHGFENKLTSQLINDEEQDMELTESKNNATQKDQWRAERDAPEVLECLEGSEENLTHEDIEDACSSCSESLGDCLADRSASMSSISSMDEDDLSEEEEGECFMQIDAPPVMTFEERRCVVRSSPQTTNSQPLGEAEVIRPLQIFDRVHLTKAIWNPKSLSATKATHLLQGREKGTFLVQGPEEGFGSFQFYVSDDSAVNKVRQFTAEYKSFKGLHMVDSERYFVNIHQLVTFYCDHHQQQQSCEPNLLLPKVIREARGQRDLNSIALLEQQFWDSPNSHRHDNIQSKSRRPLLNHPLMNIHRLALKRQTSTDSGSDIALNKRGGLDLISRYGLHAGLKSDASIFTTDDEDFLSKRPHSEHDLNDSFGLEPSNWTYQKVSSSTTSSSQMHSTVPRTDLTWNQDTDYENGLMKKLSDDSFSASNSGLTSPVAFSSTPRMQRDTKVFTFQKGRGYSVPSCLHNEYRELQTKSTSTISENKITHTSFTSGALDPSRYQLKYDASSRPETTRVVSPSSSEYTFKYSRPQLSGTSHSVTPTGSEILKTDRKQTTSSYIIRDNAPPVRLKSSEVKLPGAKLDSVTPATTKVIHRMNTTPGNYSTSNKTKSSSSVFTFNIPLSAHRPGTGSATNSKSTLHVVNESPHDFDRQASPIYALPCDALVDRVEHSRHSVNAIRAANKQSSILKSMSEIDSRRSDSNTSKISVTVSRSSSDRTPRATRFNDHDVIKQVVASAKQVGSGRPPLPKLAPLPTDYDIPFDVTPSPKIQPRGRSQSLWAFNANTPHSEVKNNSAIEVSKVTCKPYDPAQKTTVHSNHDSGVGTNTSQSFERSRTSQTKAEVTKTSTGSTPDSDLEKIELRFFTPPSSCEVKEQSANSPLKFPTPAVTVNNAQTGATVSEMISTVYPTVTLRRGQKEFVMTSTNRISAYDNVANSRPPSFRKTLAGSRTTLASSGTRYSQPWENWENLIGEVAAYESRQFTERDNKAVEFCASTGNGPIKHSTPVAAKFVTRSEAVLTQNAAENKNFSNPHRRGYESKSLTRSTKSNSSHVTTTNDSRNLTSDRKGISQIQLNRAKSSLEARSSDAKLLVEANDNFEYSEMESDIGDSLGEFFGMDVDIRPHDEVDQVRPVPQLQAITTFERSLDRRSLLMDTSEASFSQQKSPDVIPLITGPKLISDKNRGYKQSGAKICYFIVNLAKRDDLFFGRMIQNFVDCTIKGQERNPRIVTQNIRQFMNGMKNYLVRQGEKELNSYIEVEQSRMNQNDFLNIDAIMERALLKCVIKPLHDFVYKLFVEEAKTSGNLQLLSDGIKLARAKAIEDLGISAELISQHETAIEYARHFLTLMEKSYSPLKKLENILGAVAYISNAVSSETFNSSQPSASPAESNDVLRLLTYVLIQHGLISGEIEADYTWGLVHQSFLTGESRYHLATFSSAVNVIKSLRKKSERNNNQSISSSYEGFLQVVVPNEKQDKFGRHLLPVHPSMVTRDICSLMAHRLKLTNPQDYGLYSLVAKVERRLKDDANPQTVHSQAISNFQDCVLVYRRNNATFIWPRDL